MCGEKNQTHKLLLVLFLFSLYLSQNYCEDTSFVRNKFYASCFTGDDSLVVYVLPPTIHANDIKDALNDVIFEHDDWIEASSRNETITDWRWTEFGTNSSNRYEVNGDEVIAISLYAPFAPFDFRVFTVINGVSTDFVETVQNRGWYTFNLLPKHNKTILYDSEKIIPAFPKTNTLTGKRELIIKNPNATVFKIHNLKYRWANTTTQDDPLILKIPASKKACVTMYYSLCEHCFFEIYSTSAGIRNFTAKNHLALWNSEPIILQPGVENVIAIYRRTNSSEVNGMWKIDFRYCREENIVKRNVSQNEEYSCNLLTIKNIGNDSMSFNSTSALCEEPGKLGANCQRSCDEVLDSNFTYCQHSWICMNSNCSCSWGFRGDKCEEDCTEGTYGLNCTKKCDCSRCDAITGKCQSENNSTTSIIVGVAVLITIIIIIIIYLVIKKLKEKKRNSERSVPHIYWPPQESVEASELENLSTNSQADIQDGSLHFTKDHRLHTTSIENS